MNKEPIREIIKCGENSRVQFKERFTTQKQMAEELVAMANSKGGMIIIGCKDKTGEIVGLTYEEVQAISREMGNTAHEHVKPTIYLQTETFPIGENRTLLVVHVDEGMNKPYKTLSGNIYVKQGADKRRVTENAEILRLFHQSGAYFPDHEKVRGTSAIDVNRQLVDDYCKKNFGKSVDEMGLTYKQLLMNLHILTSDGECTLAGLLFFGIAPQQYLPSMMIKAVAFYGNEMGGLAYRDSKDITGTIPQLFDEGMSFLKANLHSVQAGQGFNSVGKLEISQIALEEILQNALIHREYIANAPIRILIFDNRIEIVSPGTLPSGMTVEDLKFGNTFQRNPLMAQFCSRTMQYRGIGSGILRAIKEGAQMEFDNSESGNQFAVKFRRPIDGEIASSQEDGKGVNVMDLYPDLLKRCPKLPKTEQNNARVVLHLCEQSASVVEMMEATGYESRTSFRRKILTPLLEAGLIKPVLGDKNSPKQRYTI